MTETYVSWCLFIVIFCFCFSFYNLKEMQAILPTGVAAVIWRTLLSQDFVYSPLTTPFFDLLTAADGKDMSLELLVGQVRRAES